MQLHIFCKHLLVAGSSGLRARAMEILVRPTAKLWDGKQQTSGAQELRYLFCC
jgi:hypothetical protein